MKKPIIIFLIIISSRLPVSGQDTLSFSGQLSTWLNYHNNKDLPINGGIRYLPQLSYGISNGKRYRADLEVSANITGNAGLRPFDSLPASAGIKPYRAWIRFSTEQLEIRLGLQKINFGSSMMIRPLMWFDQMDQRDPLHLTDGVWGILGRYYFLNNANIWIWGLYGNNKPRGWEIVPVNKNHPEFGGRLQLPVPAGEAAISFHHRVASSADLGSMMPSIEEIPENRIGFDSKWDLLAGFWIEGSFTHKGKDIGLLTNQMILNAGADYTFAAGNGLYLAAEQLFASSGESFTLSDPSLFSLVSLTYPLSMLDRLSAFVYYSWKDQKVFSFASWQRQYDNLSIYVMPFWNPETYRLPVQNGSQNLFAGRGIQLMFVYNH